MFVDSKPDTFRSIIYNTYEQIDQSGRTSDAIPLGDGRGDDKGCHFPFPGTQTCIQYGFYCYPRFGEKGIRGA